MPSDTVPSDTVQSDTVQSDTVQSDTVLSGGDSVPGVPVGFPSVAATITDASGEVCEVCLWVAATDDDRRRGLMAVTDLGPADGMAFVYDEPRTTRFTMRNTLIPLSIAFFDEAGGFMSAFDMIPCAAEPCPTYPTPTDFTVAVEVPEGSLASLGVGPGSVLELSASPCSDE